MSKTIPPMIEKKLLEFTVTEEARKMLEEIFEKCEVIELENDLDLLSKKISTTQRPGLTLPQCFHEFLAEIIDDIRKAVLDEVASKS